MYKVFIIEDDPIIGEMLSMYLLEEGYEVRRAVNGREGLQLLPEFAPDLVILDLILPDMNGMDICDAIRRISSVPILVVSMNTGISERVNALMGGADDFLCKPFSMRELNARIQVLIRRTHMHQTAATIEASPAIETDKQPIQIEIDTDRRSVYVNRVLIETTFSEFEIMKLFYKNQGKVYSREELINDLRGFDSFVNERSIDVHIANLRKKIEQNPKEPKHIKTVWGVGYKFVM